MGKKLSLQGTDGREESLSANKARLSGHLQGSYLSIHPSVHPIVNHLLGAKRH